MRVTRPRPAPRAASRPYRPAARASRRQCWSARCDAVITTAPSLDTTATDEDGTYSLRWVIVHMIEETAVDRRDGCVEHGARSGDTDATRGGREACHTNDRVGLRGLRRPGSVPPAAVELVGTAIRKAGLWILRRHRTVCPASNHGRYRRTARRTAVVTTPSTKAATST